MASKLSFAGIEILSSGVKWVLLDSKKKVERLGFIPVENDIEKAMESVAHLIKKSIGISRKNLKVAISLPQKSLLVKKTIVPINIENVKEYVEWDVLNYLGEETSDDFVIKYQFDNFSSSQVKAVAHCVAVRKSEIQQYIGQIEKAEFFVDIMDVDVFSLMNACELSHSTIPKAFIVRAERDGVYWIGIEDSRLQSFSMSEGVDPNNTSEMNQFVVAFQAQLNDLAKGQDIPFYLCGQLVGDLEKAKFQTEQNVIFLNPLQNAEKADKKQVIPESLGMTCANSYALALRAYEDFLGGGVNL